jgi:hypothetical protein
MSVKWGLNTKEEPVKLVKVIASPISAAIE